MIMAGDVTSDVSDSEILKVLDWYRAMGVDCAVADEATDWFQHHDDSTTASPSRSIKPPAMDHAARINSAPAIRRPVSGGTSPGEAEQDARALAAGADSLDALQQTLQIFDGCALKATAKSLCFFRGAAKARLAIVGEAPGREEDLAGKPFVGRAGQLLDKMLGAIGLSERDVHITNIVYWRPPGNRTPTPAEAQVCRPFLDRQLQLVAPDVVLVLGGAAAKHLLQVNDGIMRLRGKWHSIDMGGREVRVMATLHPAYLLRTTAAKRQAWRDLLAVRQVLSEW